MRIDLCNIPKEVEIIMKFNIIVTGVDLKCIKLGNSPEDRF
jgi:hypothetical protein